MKRKTISIALVLAMLAAAIGLTGCTTAAKGDVSSDTSAETSTETSIEGTASSKEASSMLESSSQVAPSSSVSISSDTTPDNSEGSEWISSDEKSQDTEEKTSSTATPEDDFTDDSVIVVMKKSYGGINKTYAKNYFGSEFREIKDLFYIEGNIEENSLVNKENFHQILQLFLEKPGKENVLQAIKELEKREDILSAEPNYINQHDLCVTPNDPYYTSGSQWALPKINAPAAMRLFENPDKLPTANL